MPYIELESLDDARLDVFARLTEAQLRNKLEPEKGIFIVESEKVIDRALLGGVQPLSMLMTPEWVDRTREIVARAEAACEEPGGMPVFMDSREGGGAPYGLCGDAWHSPGVPSSPAAECGRPACSS